MSKDDKGNAITYDLEITANAYDNYPEMIPVQGGDYVDTSEYKDLQSRLAAAEAKIGTLIMALEAIGQAYTADTFAHITAVAALCGEEGE